MERARSEYMLKLIRPLDREETPSLRFLVLCEDRGTPQRTGSAFILVHVADENDKSPVFTKSFYTFRLAEQVVAPDTRSFVGVVKAIDRDSGVNAKVRELGGFG